MIYRRALGLFGVIKSKEINLCEQRATVCRFQQHLLSERLFCQCQKKEQDAIREQQDAVCGIKMSNI